MLSQAKSGLSFFRIFLMLFSAAGDEWRTVVDHKFRCNEQKSDFIISEQ
jgi:hypothetical protein